MRRLTLLILLILAAGCGGGTTPTGTTSGVTPSAPASLAIVSGDGQSAAPGTMLPVKVSVLVKDASGLAVPGVQVHFSADSGGGSISAPTTTTASNGVATGGDWTLGNGSGTNVITVTVAGVTPVRLHAHAFAPDARTLVSATPLGTTGGTLTYTKTGDPLSGLSIVVPAGAYAQPTIWTVVADSSIVVPLPSGFSQVGPVLVIGNGLGVADSMMTLSMPLHVDTSNAVVPFYYDPVSHTLEAIPLGGRTTGSVTMAARHFSVNEMLIPGRGAGLRGVSGALRSPFSNVDVVWILARKSDLAGTYRSGFSPGVDDWEFVNNGDFISPEGDCEGMAITEIYYYNVFRLNGSPYLYHHFDQSLPNLWDNVQGIRLTGTVQGDARDHAAAAGQQYFRLNQENPTTDPLDWFTSQWVTMALKLTQRPVLLVLYNAEMNRGHAVVVYAVTSDGQTATVSYADPNHPGEVNHYMALGPFGLASPVMMAVNAGAPADPFTWVFGYNAASEVSVEQMQTRWAEFTNQKAGNDRYPAAPYSLQSKSSAGVVTTLTSGQEFWTTSSAPIMFFLCPSCPVEAFYGHGLQSLEIWNQAGSSIITPNGFPSLPTGISSYVAVMKAASPFANNPVTGKPLEGFVDAWPVTVRYQPLSISSDLVVPGVPATLYAHPGVLATPKSTYTWTFDDGTAPATVVVTGDSTTTRKFDVSGTYDVTVELADPEHGVLGKTEYGVAVGFLNVTLTPALLEANPGDVITYTASAGSVVPSNVTYEWSFGDEGAKIYTTMTPTINHTFTQNSPKNGTFLVSVTLSTPDHLAGGQVTIGHATTTAQIRVWPGIWRITSFSRTQAVPLPKSYHDEGSFQAVLDSIDLYMGKVLAIPTDGMILVTDDDTYPEHSVILTISRVAGAGATATTWNGGNYSTQLARTCCLAGVVTETGTVTNGTLDGWSSTTAFQGGQYNEIHAIKTPATVDGKPGGTLTGVINIWSPFQPYGERSYSFTAIKVSP